MKHKFLIQNDIGLALNKVNEVVSMMRSELFLETVEVTEDFYQIHDLLIETLSHLQQAFDNVGENE